MKILPAMSTWNGQPAHASERFTSPYKDFLARALIVLLGVVAVELWIWMLTS
jgi:hypothetical protein